MVVERMHLKGQSFVIKKKKEGKKDFNKQWAPSAVRKSSCMAGWVE